MNPVEIGDAITDLAQQPFDAAEFPFQFLTAFGNKATTIQRLRKGDSNASDVPGGVLQRNHIHLAVAEPGQVGQTLANLKASPKTSQGKVDRFRSECDQPEVPANARPPSGSRLTAASGRSGTRPGPRTDPGTLPARPKAQRHPVASRLARDARGLATMPYKPERSRAHLATDQDSCVAFSNAESGPYWMQIRVVGEADPLRQALSANVINGLSLLGNGPVSAIDSTLWREQGPLKPPLGDPSGQL